MFQGIKSKLADMGGAWTEIRPYEKTPGCVERRFVLGLA